MRIPGDRLLAMLVLLGSGAALASCGGDSNAPNTDSYLWHASGCCAAPDAVFEKINVATPAVMAGPTIASTSEITALVRNPTTGALMGVHRGDSLFTVNLTTGVQTPIGETTLDYPTGLAFELTGAKRLLAVTFNRNLYSLNVTTGLATSLGAMLLAGDSIKSATGLATDPTTGTIYGVVFLASNTGKNRTLVTINPSTLVVTKVATLGQDGIADIAFMLDGTLVGVTGDGATNPENLYSINKTTAACTFIIALGNGVDGESIAAVPGTP